KNQPDGLDRDTQILWLLSVPWHGEQKALDAAAMIDALEAAADALDARDLLAAYALSARDRIGQIMMSAAASAAGDSLHTSAANALWGVVDDFHQFVASARS